MWATYIILNFLLVTLKGKNEQVQLILIYCIEPNTSKILSFQHVINIKIIEILCVSFVLSLVNLVCDLYL